jgi:uncharacterized membrane protein (UPF0182 family)
MGKAKNWFGGIILFLVILFFMFVSKITGLITDFWWFDNLEFSEIFMITLKSKVSLFFAAALVFFVFAIINLGISTMLNTAKSPFRISFKLKILISAVLAIIIGLASYPYWFIVLQYLNQVPFDIADPILLKDAAFYVFTLPFLLAVWKFAIITVVLTSLLVVLDYMKGFVAALLTERPKRFDPESPIPKFEYKKFFPQLKRKAMVHLAVLGSILFILLAVRHYLAVFSIMFSKKGIVVGAGYTDVIIFLPIIKTLMIIAVIIAVLFYIWIFYISKHKEIRKMHIVAYAVIFYLVAFVMVPPMVTGIVQSLKVSPNEINLEKPYIENNIEFTRFAYGLSEVEEKDFQVIAGLTPETLDKAKETIDNVRILDWRPLKQTYKQTQEIRLYYDLSSIDVDRYSILGKYTQVLLAPREMNQDKIVENAKTWVNLHMVYTHGFGVVMSPVNQVTKEGLPNYLIKDIPPVSTVNEKNLKIDKPQIYYGEQENDFVLVNTNTKEFDYPKGNTNEYIQYDGKGGVQLESFFTKLLMAIKFKDIKILLSSDLTKDSRIMFNRNINERISKITPFFALDRDSYMVINEGQIYWIQDAYTVTNKFPYSEKTGEINYIRNSVKIVVDAYTGEITYYVTDLEDPIVRTYAKIFPKQFKLFETMPEGLKKHIRYPIDLFKVQSQIYATYHMNDPTVFYNKEDAWQIPHEIYGTGEQIMVEPYYIIIKLPGEQKGEYVLMTSFTPIRKDNMISWLAARSDNANYGKLLLYKFPKNKLVFGPLQIEAKFDQDSEISQQLTLWSQQGSRVTRGNLLIIPIDDSILYVEPLYIQAEQGQLPELKRVLVSDGERVVMEKDLSSALEVLFGKKAQISLETGEAKANDELIKEAQQHYDDILEAMAGNNWAAFGTSFDDLGNVLEQLK